MSLVKKKARWKDKNKEDSIDLLFKPLFSINNIENNLIYLKIFFDFGRLSENEIEKDIFEKINNLKSLKYLYLRRIFVDEEIVININNLILFYCELCNNITIKDGKLKKLYYPSNNLKNIDFLKDANFNELKELELFHNYISDIKVLEQVKFDHLNILDLSLNNISNINILENVNFKDLKILNLHNNNIDDITVLEKVKFEKLQELYLGRNNISDITPLEKANFKELEILNLSENNISNIDSLKKVHFCKLKILDLSSIKIKSDKIKEINFNDIFKELKKLRLY